MFLTLHYLLTWFKSVQFENLDQTGSSQIKVGLDQYKSVTIGTNNSHLNLIGLNQIKLDKLRSNQIKLVYISFGLDCINLRS